MMKLRAQVFVKNVKDNLKENKFAYIMGAVAIGAVALQQANVKAFTKFMIEKNIDPNEYFCPELVEEMNQ